MSKIMNIVDVAHDEGTVWVTGPDGSCVGRFSKRFGLDVHRTVEDQIAGKPQCLHCTHEPATWQDWLTFCDDMFINFGIRVEYSLLKKWGSAVIVEVESDEDEGHTVSYFEGDDLVDTTSIDEPSEKLAWELYAEFGHVRTENTKVVIS